MPNTTPTSSKQLSTSAQQTKAVEKQIKSADQKPQPIPACKSAEQEKEREIRELSKSSGLSLEHAREMANNWYMNQQVKASARDPVEEENEEMAAIYGLPIEEIKEIRSMWEAKKCKPLLNLGGFTLF